MVAEEGRVVIAGIAIGKGPPLILLVSSIVGVAKLALNNIVAGMAPAIYIV
jgi:hypothetical protein